MASPTGCFLRKPPLPADAFHARARPRWATRRSCCCCSSSSLSSDSLSMDGCGAIGRGVEPVEVCETRVLPAAQSPDLAVPQLRSAVAALEADPPSARSGILRVEVPIEERVEIMGWLQVQEATPRCFFSGREKSGELGEAVVNGGGRAGGEPMSVAGVGSAVYFRRLADPFALEDWRCIKRFLSRSCPFIRAYGAMRFDPRNKISNEWREFGSFYFFVPQVEFINFRQTSKLAVNIAWDESLWWPWRKAVDRLKATIQKISPMSQEWQKRIPSATILSSSNVPTCKSWKITVNKALEMIRRENSDLLKVVLARSSKLVTDADIDPVTLLACLLVEGQNAYQFCIQPPNAPAFIGNTPEQLFHRKDLNVSSEALAGTRARGRSKDEDLQIEQDLLLSIKDDMEFTIVRESIRKKLETICKEVIVEPSKAVRKLPRIQHLSAQLTARLRSEDDELDVLYSLHPSPAVCGLPTEKARQFIAETEIFDRGMYAGPVGWFGGSESEFAVGIRSALIEKGGGIYIYAGAGIVEGTNPASEWDEVDLKASQFTKLLEQGSLRFSRKFNVTHHHLK